MGICKKIFNKLKMNKRSQISIFIIFAIIILLGFITSTYLSLNSQKEDIKDTLDEITDQNIQKELSMLKNLFQSCLDMTLKKAILISAYKGGFIYDDTNTNSDATKFVNTFASFYSPSELSKIDAYEPKTLIPNFFCSPQTNNICEKNFTSQNEIILFYNKSIEDDIKKYINYHFMSCIENENFKNQTILDITYTDTYGKLISGPKKPYSDRDIWVVQATKIDTIKEDKVVLSTNQNIIGTVSNINKGIISITFNQEPIIPTNVLIENVGVIKINNQLNSSIIFEENSVHLKLKNPLIIKKKNSSDNSLFFETLDSKIDIPYKNFLKISQKLKEKKYINKANINLALNGDILKNIINKEDIITFDELKLINTKIIDDESHKLYVYSIYSPNIKLFNMIFYFNFGYENIAPKIIDISPRFNNLNINNQTNTISFEIEKGIEYQNVRFIYEDSDNFDQYFNSNFFQLETITPFDGNFIIDNSGKITQIMGRKKGDYSYNLIITDNEVKNQYQLLIKVI